MEEFSGDEVFALFVFGAATVIGAFRYYRSLIGVTVVGERVGTRGILAIVPPACLALLLPVLLHWTAHEVQDDHGYVVLFLAGGGAWIDAAMILAAWLGVSFRDDAIERRNSAAAVVIGGAMLGITLVYGGANIGEGATVWMTFGPGALGAMVWSGGWMLLEWFCGFGDAVAIERDGASAWRLAGFLVASGAIIGWGVAGNFVSAEATVRDLVWRAWPIVPLAIVVAVVQNGREAR